MKMKTQKKTYIVHMDKSNMPSAYKTHLHWFDSSLNSVSDAPMLYSYTEVIHGYSARLDPAEAQLLERQPGVLSIQEDVKLELHTTRTPFFLGLEETQDVIFANAIRRSKSDVIVGVIDTGVSPESRSFDDSGLGPVPKTWNGACEAGDNFNSSRCNRKLVGARFFCSGYEAANGPVDPTVESRSPADDDGHGTHTASTAAGSPVAGANLFGLGSGTARGMAPRARVAAYKACWLDGCLTSDILAAFESAIADGVDVLSVSLGAAAVEYFNDPIAIGAFAATSRGIFVSCSAGNGGPFPSSLSNVAPWIATVGAGTIDRVFPAYVRLGNGKEFEGVSLYRGGSSAASGVPLVYAGSNGTSSDGGLCTAGSLVPNKVAGKIVVCNRGENRRAEKGLVVRDAGGVGMILANTELGEDDRIADAHLIPTVAVGAAMGEAIKNYISSARNPTATVRFEETEVGVQPSPVVAAFSSRGPNSVTPGILKPDFIAPGVNILASWTRRAGPTGMPEDKRRVGFNIISGTSMSCPHVSGLAALLKTAHPDWSPAAIRSALMTTAYGTYRNGKPLEDAGNGMASTPFDHGSGHVDPVSGLDPGLVYDATVGDYTDFLCATGYSGKEIKMITKRDVSCGRAGKKPGIADLNYPSFAVPFETASGKGEDKTTLVKYSRVVTNVGKPATYRVSFSSQTKSVKMVVEPQVLSFSRMKEKKNYTVTFIASSMPSGTTGFGHLQWSDGKHNVHSPIAFTWT